LALTLNSRTRRCTQLIRSSMVASRFGISLSIAVASAGRPNPILAEIRDGVVSGGAFQCSLRAALVRCLLRSAKFPRPAQRMIGDENVS
jgi:hypothetical protein